MDDDTLLEAFENQTVTRAEWTHEAHVRTAWIYARRMDTEEEVLEKLGTGIRGINAVLSTDPTLYNETVTCAFGILVRNRSVAPDAPITWPDFRDAHPELFDRERPILHRHYSQTALESEDARLTFVPPDLAPLD